MTSEELHSEIVQTVSSRLDLDTYRRDGESSVQSCEDCRQGFERELEQKMVVQKRYSTTGGAETVPDALERSIEAITRAETRRRSSYRRRSRRPGTAVPLFILLVLILGLATYIILFDDKPDQPEAIATQETTTQKRAPIPEPTRRSTGPVNLFNQAMTNYETWLAGTLEVEYDEDDLVNLTKELVSHGVPSVEFKGASMPLEGGVVSERGGVNLPHFLYKDGDARLYVTEIPLQTLKEGKGFYVTEDVLTQLEGGTPIWMEAPGKGNLVMYKEGDIVFVAVANRSSAEVKRLLGMP
ncbi:MAG: hypothetical protein KDD67_04855 [Ignavibacteriae bacterium]|nr:hypothetical protein [Ignavibacteriota bacterium]MCB9216341.1 hypothetical protein [Ignavibacteria bacterium]